MASIEVTLDLRGVDRELQRLVAPAMDRLGRRLVDRTRVELTAGSNASVDTGALRRSIEKRVDRTSSGYSVTVFTNVPYARLVHDSPAYPGRIYPKRSKFLRFKPKGSSVFVFAKSVKAAKPRPFLADALRKAQATGLVRLMRP